MAERTQPPVSLDTQPAAGSGWKRAGWVLALATMTPMVWYAVRYLRSESTALPRVGSDDVPEVLALFFSLALVMITNGLILRDLLAKFGANLQIRAWLGITLVASMLNLVSPIKGGAALRAVYLKRMHGVAYGAFAGVLGTSLFTSIAVSGGLAAVALVALGVPGGRFGWIMLAISLALAASLPIMLRICPPAEAHQSGWAGRLARIVAAWRAVRSDRVLIARMVGWSVAGSLLHAVAFVMAFRLASYPIHWLVPTAASAFARIGALISITPAGLGIYEAFGAVSASIVGADPGRAILAVLIVRLASMLVSVVGGVAFLPLILRESRNDTVVLEKKMPQPVEDKSS